MTRKLQNSNSSALSPSRISKRSARFATGSARGLWDARRATFDTEDWICMVLADPLSEQSVKQSLRLLQPFSRFYLGDHVMQIRQQERLFGCRDFSFLSVGFESF